ncbi:hypothetical protein AT6N2_C2084 [Agrobacterium tumefaciens]|nr:hypothetical protein AT6N2_C2084 [Agrobacterium tumefaciens]
MKRRPVSAEAAHDVILRALIIRIGEHLVGFVFLNKMTKVEHGRALGNTRRLLHGVRDDDDGVVCPQLVDQFLDLRGGNRVQRRAGLVHQDHFRADGDRTGDAKALLLTAGKARAGLMQTVLHLVPETGSLEALLNDQVHIRLVAGEPVDPRAVGNVFVDRLREGVRLLEHHTDAGAQFHHIDRLVIDIVGIERDLAGDAATVDRVVHTVQGAQERGFAAARGADQRGHGVFPDVEVHVVKRALFAVINRYVLTDHLV